MVLQNVIPIFKPKHGVPFAVVGDINKELDIETLGFISRTDYSEWAVQTEYVKKRSNTIRVCSAFVQG